MRCLLILLREAEKACEVKKVMTTGTTVQTIQQPVICYHNLSYPGDQRQHNLPYHYHDAYEIYLFLGGNANLYIEQSCFHLISGDLFLISPEQLHRSVVLDSQPYDRVVINIKEDVLKALSSDSTDLSVCFDSKALKPGSVRHTRLDGEQLSHYVYLVKQYWLCRQREDYGSDILRHAYLSQLLVLINQCFFQRSYLKDRNIMPDLVRQTMAFISENLTESITLSRLSKHFFLSGAYISSQFKQHTGLTLRDYILEQRLSLAKRLLREGCNVSEACCQSGFVDYSNFIRSFTQRVGVSPGKFSKQHQLQ